MPFAKASLDDGVFTADEYINDVLLKRTINYVCGAPYSKLFKTDIINKHSIKFDESLSYAEDFLFNISYLEFASKIITTSTPLYNYILFNNNSLTNINYAKASFESFFEARLYVYKHYEEILFRINPHLEKLAVYQLLVEFVLNSANYACIKNDLKTAKNLIKNMISNDFVYQRISAVKMNSKKDNFKLKLLKKRHLNIYYLLSTLKGRKK